MRRPWSSPETAGRVLADLREHADESGEVAGSWQAIGERLDLGRNTVGNAIRRLVDTGQVEVARIGTGRDYPTRYRLVVDREGAAA